MLSLEYLRSKLVNYSEVIILIYKEEKGTANQGRTYLLIITKESWEYLQVPTGKVLKSYVFLNLFSNFFFKCTLRFLETRCFLEEVVLTSNQEMSFILKRILIKDLTSKAIKDLKVFCRTRETSLDFCML